MIVAHADCGAQPPKQWVAIARQDVKGRWTAFAPQRVLAAGTLRERLHLEDEAETAVMGFDFPIGIPRAYASRVGATNFLDFLWGGCTRDEWREFFEVADNQDEISLHRPFYPRTFRPKGAKKHDHLVSALGIDFPALRRRCERASPERPAACPLFWTLGPNSVGKGALAGWRLLQAEPRESLLVWPFDGDLNDLLTSGATVVAETYPAEFSRHIGLGRVNGKQRQSVRRMHSEGLLDFAVDLNVDVEPELERRIRDGFGSRSSGDDEFDAAIGMFGMLIVLKKRRGAGDPRDDPAIRTVEGWMLGQAAT
jgi:hypothetical protein